MKKALSLLLAAALVLLCSACGSSTKPVQAVSGVPAGPDASEEVRLVICGPWASCKAIESAAQAFTAQHPNCEIEYEYLQNYDESLQIRLENAPDSVDLFLSNNILEGSPLLPYVEDLATHPELDLSQTNPALIKNFTYKTVGPSGIPSLYVIPLGGELRGLFVNKTLLASQGLSVPTNVQELLEACEVLKTAGYIPMMGNPGVFGQRLLYPYVCNLVANAEDYQATYDRVNRCEAGVSELFRPPMELMYTLVENGYYNYKYVETELNLCTDLSDEGSARDFFSIVKQGDDYVKADDVGNMAFLAATLTLNSAMEKCKEDYHSAIDYEFILAPVSEEGGFAYFSPGRGIALNKNSLHADWAIAFLNFLFQADNNTRFATEIGYIPNKADSFGFIRESYDIPDSQISDLGQATFDYEFYSVIQENLMTVSKGNNPKYMDTDASGNPVMYSLDVYMAQLEDAFAAHREGGK